jgi:probable HAF family extracellular repeat protein
MTIRAMKALRTAFLFAAVSIGYADTPTDLGVLPGGSASAAWGVSADGSVIVGFSDSGSGTRAFRWTSAGMASLGTLPGGNYSYARDVSADGSVVVGVSTSTIPGTRAFRWTATGGMADLGTLVGGSGYTAYGVSADGEVVVGAANLSAGGTRAFRWTAGTGMLSLGTLGGSTSIAYASSADGSVVVGDSSNGVNARAFRWTAGGGMVDLGTLPGGLTAYARGVSADGSVIVGSANVSPSITRAFRWTVGGGMADLGTLSGGGSSQAFAVSANGSIVVGQAVLGSSFHAFLWSPAGGMTDIGVLPGGTSSAAYAISADGSVVVGQASIGAQTHAFIYHNRVMLDAEDWLGSVAGVHSLLSASLEMPRNYFEGAHHRPLAELGVGRSFWATGDIASSSRTRDLFARSGEAGATFLPAPNLLVGLGGGYGLQDQNLINGGSARIHGQYLVAEADLLRQDGGIFSLLLSLGDWGYVADRGYVTGGGVDFSHGTTNISTRTARLRYDSPVLATAYGADLKAYVSYYLSKAQADAFAETGGSYAGSFGAMEQTAKEGRVGAAIYRAIGEKTNLRFSAEWIRRYDHGQPALTATDITSTIDVSLPTPDPVRDQARFGLDVDHKLDDKTTLSFTVHVAGIGESPDVSGAISLRRSF